MGKMKKTRDAALKAKIAFEAAKGEKTTTQLASEYRVHPNQKRIRRLMRAMGLEAIYPKRNLSISSSEHKKYPYLLRDLTIEHPDQVWCTDITYIRMAQGFLYLIAIMDWHSRYVLSWRLSNTFSCRVLS